MRWHQLLVLFFGFAGACAAPLAPDPAVAVAGPFAVAVDQPLPGAISPFAAGCGTGIRQTDDAPFTYLEPTRGRAIAASYLTAFFLGTLQRNSGAIAYLQSQTDWVEVTAVHR